MHIAFVQQGFGPSLQPSHQWMRPHTTLQQIALHRLPHLTMDAMDQHGPTMTLGQKAKGRKGKHSLLVAHVAVSQNEEG